MVSFFMLTRVSPDAIRTPDSLDELERKARERIRAECPSVKWISSYAVLRPYDYLDVFEAPDHETATKVSALIRTFGRSASEICPATDWKRVKQMIEKMPRS